MNPIIEKLKKYRFFEDFFNEKSFAQFIKYLITGFSSFAIEWTFFKILVEAVKLNYIVANIIVYSVMFWFVFLINRFWSFQSKGNLSRQLKYYVVLFGFNLVVANIGLMLFLTRILKIDPLIAKPLVMCAVVSWNFIIYKKVIYKT